MTDRFDEEAKKLCAWTMHSNCDSCRQIAQALRQEREKTLEEFYKEVCELAEKNMLTTGKLEGAHFAAMKTILEKEKSK